MRLFGRRPTESAARKRERLPVEAIMRAAREEEEARLVAERDAAQSEAFEAHVRAVRVWFPGDSYAPLPSRLSGRPSWPARLFERIFGGWS